MNINDARKLSIQELYKEIQSQEREAFKLRMKLGSGQTVRHHKFNELRRMGARLRTIISEKMRETQ